jgi:preprotein translocase subunit SecG
VVNRYACAATRAASGVSCMKFFSSSDNGAMILLARFSSLLCVVFLLLCFGSRCLSVMSHLRTKVEHLC